MSPTTRDVAPLGSLVPRPQHVEVKDGEANLADIEFVADADGLPPEGYRIATSSSGTTVQYGDRGLAYARDTVGQLLSLSVTLPAFVLEDWPDIPNRGFLLDVSRNRVPTRATLAWLVDVLASTRFNHLELYVEHTFAYRGHEPVWRGCSPLTKSDLIWLSRICRERGIELVPSLNCFGHMERWLAHERNSERAECSSPIPSPLAPGKRVPPSCLAPTAENAAFVVELASELMSPVSSSTIHVGGDEPFDLGKGASREEVRERGFSTVYVEHLRRVMDPLIEKGKHVLFWADMFRRPGSPIEALPSAGATAVSWNYDSPAAATSALRLLPPEVVDVIGLPQDASTGFESHVRELCSAGFPTWVAPGTSSWNSIVGRWTNAEANVRDAIAVCRSRDLGGLLLCDWGDNGHLQPLAVSLPSIALAGSLAWCEESNREADVARIVDRLAEYPGLGDHLTSLGIVGDQLGIYSFNATPIFTSLFPEPITYESGTLNVEGWDHAKNVVDDAAREFAQRLSEEPTDPIGRQVLSAVLLARAGLEALRDREGGAGTRAPIPADTVSAIVDAWLSGSRPGGMKESLALLAGESPSRPVAC